MPYVRPGRVVWPAPPGRAPCPMKDLFAEALNNAATDSITETERNIVGQAGTHHRQIGGNHYWVRGGPSV